MVFPYGRTLFGNKRNEPFLHTTWMHLKIIKESTFCDEHRVSSGSDEPVYCTPETTITLYIN